MRRWPDCWHSFRSNGREQATLGSMPSSRLRLVASLLADLLKKEPIGRGLKLPAVAGLQHSSECPRLFRPVEPRTDLYLEIVCLYASVNTKLAKLPVH
jgi:hypothetical protein